MNRLLGLLKLALILGLGATVLAVLAGVAAYTYLVPRLPSTQALRDVQLQTPLRVYTKDRKLVAEYGEKRRQPVRYQEVPQQVLQAFLAAEDERFFTHPGVDWRGLMRAVVFLVRTGEKGPGGSTITMQVARNFLLTREKTYLRKLNEILLALKIERELTKNEIFELYLNKIFLGQRAYGVGAAAQVYYGRPLERLELAQVAMIAGLPKAPSKFNPVVNPERALTRRNYVLGRMRDLGFIDTKEYEAAREVGATAKVHGLLVEAEAPYLAEMVRAQMEEKYGEDAYTRGFKVYLTANSRLQEAANTALRVALLDYDQRHGYRGPEGKVEADLDDKAAVTRVLADYRAIADLAPAVVTDVFAQSAMVIVRGGIHVELAWDGIQWARAYKTENRVGPELKNASEALAVGDLVRVRLVEEGWRLSQLPEVEGAFVALDPETGAIRALTGGFHFDKSKFNRAIQAERQPGSSFKPFIYSAALAKGYTAASFVNDAPVVFDDVSLEDSWRPENYSGKFFGPTRIREALYKSRNLVSIRLLQSIGIDYALDHIKRFGFDVSRLPPNLSLALGSGVVKPIEIARGYTVLANGGYLVGEPYFISEIVDGDGNVMFREDPVKVCRECPEPSGEIHAARLSAGEDATATPMAAPSGAGGSGASAPSARPDVDARIAPRTLPADNAYIMNSIMRDVVRRGTARRAGVLKRQDLAGKTGTTNDQHDAWFSGFVPGLVGTAWVGFDQLKPLGRRETGGRAALPVWVDFMKVALDGIPEQYLEQPEGIVQVRIDPVTGKLAAPDDPDAEFEVFRAAFVPKDLSRKRIVPVQPEPGSTGEQPENTVKRGGSVTEKLF